LGVAGPTPDLGAAARPRLPFSGFDASSDSYGRAFSLRMRAADHGRLTTTIEGRLAPQGPIGSLGLQTSRDGPDVPLLDLNNAAVMGPHGPEAKIGGRIAYRF